MAERSKTPNSRLTNIRHRTAVADLREKLGYDGEVHYIPPNPKLKDGVVIVLSDPENLSTLSNTPYVEGVTGDPFARALKNMFLKKLAEKKRLLDADKNKGKGELSSKENMVTIGNKESSAIVTSVNQISDCTDEHQQPDSFMSTENCSTSKTNVDKNKGKGDLSVEENMVTIGNQENSDENKEKCDPSSKENMVTVGNEENAAIATTINNISNCTDEHQQPDSFMSTENCNTSKTNVVQVEELSHVIPKIFNKSEKIMDDLVHQQSAIVISTENTSEEICANFVKKDDFEPNDSCQMEVDKMSYATPANSSTTEKSLDNFGDQQETIVTSEKSSDICSNQADVELIGICQMEVDKTSYISALEIPSTTVKLLDNFDQDDVEMTAQAVVQGLKESLEDLTATQEIVQGLKEEKSLEDLSASELGEILVEAILQ